MMIPFIFQLGQNILLPPIQAPKNLLAVEETTKSYEERYQTMDTNQLSTVLYTSVHSKGCLKLAISTHCMTANVTGNILLRARLIKFYINKLLHGMA
jgi:hypothetical protein